MKPKLCTADKKSGIFQKIRTNVINNCFKLLNCYILQLIKIISIIECSFYIMHKFILGIV